MKYWYEIALARAILIVAVCAALAMVIAGCGGGDDNSQETTIQTEYGLEIVPGTTSSYHGSIEVCPAPWIAPREMAAEASLDYAPNITVYVNFKEVGNPHSFHVDKGDIVFVCATMPAPITILHGSVTIREIQPMPALCNPDPKVCA